GIDFDTGNASPRARILQAIRQHKTSCHPRVRWLKWAKLSCRDRAEKATVTRFNASSAALISQKAHPLAKFEVFRWPRKVGPKSQAISPIAFRPAWVCKTCHATCRVAKLAEEHAATNCPNKAASGLLKTWAHGRLSTLAADRKIFLQGPNSSEAKARGIALFDQAFSFNAASRGVSCGAALRPILVRHSFDLVAMSEAHIPAASRVAFAAEWKRCGWSVVFSAPEEQYCQVCLLSQIPLKQVSVCSQDGAARHAAALLDLKSARGNVPLLAVAVYLQSGKPLVAQAQASDILAGAQSSGRRCLVFGDWNLVQEEGDLAALLQANVVHSCDEAAWGQELPPTGPVCQGSRRRRIDYAVSIGDFRATAVGHVAEDEVGVLSDHRLVHYTFDASAPPALRGPKRRRLLDKDALPTADVLLPALEVQLFHRCLQEGDVDEAWRRLSDLAEDLVCKPAGDAPDLVPRSRAWEPQPRKVRTDFEAEMDKSPGLRALRRLHARLLLCARRPWDSPLLRATGAMAARTRAKVPALGFVRCEDPAALCHVQHLIATLEEDEKQLHLEKWKSLLQCDPARVRSYVKRRADAALVAQQVPDNIAQVKDGWRPAIAVEEQAARWTEVWCKPPGHDPVAIERILAAVPQPRPCSVQFRFSPGVLKAAMQSMHGKAAGADDSTPSEMIHLPWFWWDLASQLWSTIVEVRRVPCISGNKPG
ncbi:unnamed protein product, partial [Symbiodinium sp. CCMP2456]